jgi:hypothetical protein
MARFIGVLVIIALLIAGFGYYRGWFHIGTTNEGDKTNINIGVDTQKIREDEHKAEEGLRKLGTKASDEVDKLKKKDKKSDESPKD